MNYTATLEYMFLQLPMFQRIGGAAYKANLDNTIAILNLLDNPQHKFKSVHIAGTNGKGSVSHYLAAIFQRAGFKTGLYTSPHLKDFRERIKINGKMISKQKELSNTIIVTDGKIWKYLYPVLLAMTPKIYDNYDEIKLQVTIANLSNAEHLIKLFKYAGLYEENREKIKIKVNPPSGQAYWLNDAFEITLKKIPALLHI